MVSMDKAPSSQGVGVRGANNIPVNKLMNKEVQVVFTLCRKHTHAGAWSGGREAASPRCARKVMALRRECLRKGSRSPPPSMLCEQELCPQPVETEALQESGEP